jgi:transglutaminase-like putative cysteine protease
MFERTGGARLVGLPPPSKMPARRCDELALCRGRIVTTLRIVHTTRYRYDRPVRFGVHRLMLRPRDAHDMRLLGSALTVSPKAVVDWTFDVFGNSIGALTFLEEGETLLIVSELELRRYGLDDPLPALERRAAPYPFRYDADERVDLAPLRRLLFARERAAVERFLAAAIPLLPGRSVALLDALSTAINERFRYSRREAYGVQSPAETIARGAGTCRDFALLFMEAARVLGFAARFVTGYLYDPASDAAPAGLRGGGATHAWADAFVPGVGWVEFDPTNRIAASRNLVRVATTRTPAQAVPVRGSWRAAAGACALAMEVSVEVSRVA